MPTFRAKPVVIEAVQWKGWNDEEIATFCPLARKGEYPVNCYEIPTLEGLITARAGDWIIRGERGEFRSCNPDTFAGAYERV